MADHPIPPHQDYYFEVKISLEGNNRYVAIRIADPLLHVVFLAPFC
jgi:hypothetical protein